MCMSSPVAAMTFTETTFVVAMENGLIAEFSIEEIFEKTGGEKPVRKKSKGRKIGSENSLFSELKKTGEEFRPSVPTLDLKDTSKKPNQVYDLSPHPTVASVSHPAKSLISSSGYVYFPHLNTVSACPAGKISEVDFTTSTISMSNYDSTAMSDAELLRLLASTESVTEAHVVMAHSWPLYVAGTSHGRVIVMPLASRYPIRCLDPGDMEAVSCLMYYRSWLISCSVSGNVHIWSLTTQDLSGDFTSSNLSEAEQSIDLQRYPPIRTFSITHQRLKLLKQIHILHEVVEKLPEDRWFDKYKYWQMTVISQSEDDSLVLISVEKCTEICAFYGVKGKLKDTYVHLTLDYLFVSSQEGDCYVFNMVSLQLERVFPMDLFPYKSFHKHPCVPPVEVLEGNFPCQFLDCSLPSLTPHHSNALVWTEYPVISGVQLPVLCLNLGLLVHSLEQMETLPQQTEFVLSIVKMWVQGDKEEEKYIQNALKEMFNAFDPAIRGTAGVFGCEEAISFPLPTGISCYEVSNHLTSLISLSLLTFFHSILRFRPSFSPILDQKIIPSLQNSQTFCEFYRKPALILYGIEALHGSKVAFRLLQSSLQQFSQEEREKMTEEWMFLHNSALVVGKSMDFSDVEGSPLLEIGLNRSFSMRTVSFIEGLSGIMVGLLTKSGVKVPSITEIAVTLLCMLHSESKNYTLPAIYTLCCGIASWRSDISKQLYRDTVMALLRLHFEGEMLVQEEAKQALMTVGKADVGNFAKALDAEVRKLARGRDYPASILVVLQSFLETHISNSVYVLPEFTEIVLHSLNPKEILLRKLCVERATEVLETLVHTYPMVSFHPELQLLALGSFSNRIFIYDLKLGVKWKELNAHIGPVSAVEFSKKGDKLASYSTSDRVVRIWKVEGAFFGLGSLDIEAEQTVEMPDVCAQVTSTRELLYTVKLEWKSKRALFLTREDAHTYLIPVD